MKLLFQIIQQISVYISEMRHCCYFKGSSSEFSNAYQVQQKEAEGYSSQNASLATKMSIAIQNE